MKSIILAGRSGTRFYRLPIAISKQMLPVFIRAMRPRHGIKIACPQNGTTDCAFHLQRRAGELAHHD